MKLRCNACGEEFDDKYYLQNKNEAGYEDILLHHIKKHENEIKIKNNFTGITDDL